MACCDYDEYAEVLHAVRSSMLAEGGQTPPPSQLEDGAAGVGFQVGSAVAHANQSNKPGESVDAGPALPDVLGSDELNLVWTRPSSKSGSNTRPREKSNMASISTTIIGRRSATGKHPLMKHPDILKSIRLIRSQDFAALPIPLPRCQDLADSFFGTPEAGDIVVAVSHAWRNQARRSPSPGANANNNTN